MTIVNPPSWLQAGTYNAKADRLGVGSLLDVPGVTDTASMAVSQTSTPSMSILVSAGTAYVQNTYSAYQGYYVVVNDSAVTVPLSASHANFARIDTIILTVHDAQYAGVDNFAEITVVQGVPSSFPFAGAVPDSSIVLGTVLVPALSSSLPNANISVSTRQYAKFKSTMVDVNRVVTSLTRPSNPYVGQTVFETNTQAVRLWTGTTWRVISPITTLNVASNARPGGVQAWPGLIIRETDTDRLFTWSGTAWAYMGGGGGEPLPPLFAWSPSYTATPLAGHRPIEMWRDASGRIRISGTFSNNVDFTGWNMNIQYGVAVIQPDYIPQNDIALVGQVSMPAIGNDVFNLIIRGAVGGGWLGSPGTIIFQPSTTRNTLLPKGTLVFSIPETSWKQR